MSQAIGLDAGGTLTKLAYLDENNQLKLKHFPSNNMPAIINWINSKHNIKEIGITGGRAEHLLM